MEKHTQTDVARENEKILDAVYQHGVREGDKPGSRVDIIKLPKDELTIAAALKMLNNKDTAQYRAGLIMAIDIANSHVKQEYLIKGKSDSWAQGNNTACQDIAHALQAEADRLERGKG